MSKKKETRNYEKQMSDLETVLKGRNDEDMLLMHGLIQEHLKEKQIDLEKPFDESFELKKTENGMLRISRKEPTKTKLKLRQSLVFNEWLRVSCPTTYKALEKEFLKNSDMRKASGLSLGF